MRFVISGEWKTNSLLRLIIALFLVFVVLIIVSNFLLFFEHMALDAIEVKRHYLGRATEYTKPTPRSYKTILEVSHMHLFSIGILVMTLTHLILFVPAPGAAKAWLVIVTFVSALLNEGSIWLIRYVHPGFAWFKIVMFLVMQLALIGIVILLSLSLTLRWRNAYTDTDKTRGGKKAQR